MNDVMCIDFINAILFNSQWIYMHLQSFISFLRQLLKEE